MSTYLGQVAPFIIIQLIFQLLIAIPIAYFLGRKRLIGFGWSLFFCLTFTPIFGFIITMLSSKYSDATLNKSNARLFVGIALIVLGVMLTYMGLFNAELLLTDGLSPITSLVLGIGFVGAGIYLKERSKGRSFHSKAIANK